jgi:hypothetical protein
MRRTIELLALSNLLIFFGSPLFAQDQGRAARGQRATTEQKQIVIERGNTRIAVSSSPSTRFSSAAPLERWEITSARGLGRADALEKVLSNADDRLRLYLREQRPNSDWSKKQLREVVLKMWNPTKSQADTELTEEERREQLDGKQFWVMEGELLLTAPIKEEISRKLRFEEAKRRQWWVTKGLLGVLALLATVGIYYRLDDRTKGYYTNMLRLGALAILGLAGYGIAHLP